MTGPVWVPLAAIIAIHDRQIARHGGAAGLRDRALLEAGCARAMNRAAYSDATQAQIAAAYAFGISKAHAFVDGNKRTAFVTALTFLRLNGYAFQTNPVDGVRMMEDLAASAIDEARFAEWLLQGMTAI
ncbi:type II toxin-antitoxin system death-on-curing family toxin [Roseinatronobacter sp.]|uniref:type II toxin-antitoxin system death-on-curing family toxin n=1 Tax=Roseinatronobacter sp. TaxID=1945755 RepID=UPI0025D0C73C|nr:type II toxin-antitoxin system death-on-curing family toxin [Roseibaca sp.]